MKRLVEEKDGKLYYNGYCLVDLAKRFGTPLTVTFLDIIKERILSLKDAFNNAKLATNYKGDFIYLNANKANYGKDEIESARAWLKITSKSTCVCKYDWPAL